MADVEQEQQVQQVLEREQDFSCGEDDEPYVTQCQENDGLYSPSERHLQSKLPSFEAKRNKEPLGAV